MSNPGRIPISIFLITRNEADRLGRTLEAVADLTDDLVVVDSGSVDATVRLAEDAGARVVLNAWPGFGLQKRFAEDLCRHPWLLNIDADEVVQPPLAAEIRALFALGEPSEHAYRVRIAEVFPGEGAPHPLTYALSPVRLYRRDRGRYSRSPVHDRVELSPGARVGRLKGVVLHYSVRSLGDQIAKLNAYTDSQAEDLAARGQRVRRARLFVEFPAAFVKAYVFRRHFVRGAYGFMTAMNYAYYRWLRIAKALAREREKSASSRSRP